MKRHRNPTAKQIRDRIERSTGSYWRHNDFADLPPFAVSQTLSRLVKAGVLERVSKGLYYRPALPALVALIPPRARFNPYL
jgi:hypothetical protein